MTVTFFAGTSDQVTPDVSIVVVNWNTRDILRQCLQAVLRTCGVTYEVWVVDNGSADGSADMVCSEFPDINLISNQENAGFAKANNQVLRICRGRYALLLNSDAFMLPDALARLVAFMDQSHNTGAVGPCYANLDGSFQASYADFPTLTNEIIRCSGVSRLLLNKHFPSHEPADSQTNRAVDWIPGTCLLVRVSAMADVGLLDEGYFFYYEEVDWCYRMRQKGWSVWYLSEVVVRHGLGQSSRKVSAASLWHLYRGRVRYFAKHHGSFQASFLKAMLIVHLMAKACISGMAAAFRESQHSSWRTYRDVAVKLFREPLTIP